MSKLAEGALLHCSTPGLGPLVSYDSDIGGGMIAVRDPERPASHPTFALAAACEPWDCDRHGHKIHLWHEAKRQDKTMRDAQGRVVEYGGCMVCGARETRTSAMSESDATKVVCGTCGGTGWRQDLVQEVIGVRGTKPCPSCAPDQDRA